MNLEKELVPYKMAVELRDLGISEGCMAFWSKGLHELAVPAPTFSHAFRWFREKHNILQSIDWMTRSGGSHPSGYIVYFRGINGNKLNDDNFIGYNKTEFPGYEVIPTYEEAQMACVKELINMVKNKQS